MRRRRLYAPNDRRWARRKSEPLRAYFFVHINRTGGRSVAEALDIRGKAGHCTVRDDKFRRHHAPGCFVFTFVRNPWDRVHSQYVFRCPRDLRGDRVGFAEWIQLTYRQRDPTYFLWGERLYANQVDWITGEDGRIQANFIGRFENLQEDFATVCERIGIRATALPHVGRTNKESYKSCYDPESRRIIEECFHKDIEKFGYRF